ncbi:hypothetical protein [Streptomyces racemochromogenes]|uniref:hypothetical protein n=1 Tax=Streptomyces racemochromogenes TaxID=67353 RepID=UPI0035E4B752
MKNRFEDRSPRGVVLAVLGAVTLGVAVLSVAVSYQILEPRFGGWAVPTVGALDALWVAFQLTEVLAGNQRGRARRVMFAGLALTVVIAGLPTADLILNRSPGHRFDLAMVLTPVAILATKAAWWIVLPSLGRRTSAATRRELDDKRQDVADRLEEMEAEAAHRIELLELATELEQRVAEAETAYRKSVLRSQQSMTEELHAQAAATAKTVAAKPLPVSVAAIELPVLGEWAATAPALPGTARAALGTQVSAPSGTGGGTGAGPAGQPPVQRVTLAELAAVAGVPLPQRGVALTDPQLDVVLRHLRYADDPPESYRQARAHFGRAGYVGSEHRVRQAWNVLAAQDPSAGAEESEGADDEPEDADV